MGLDLIVIGKTLGGKLLTWAASWTTDRLTKWVAQARAMRGDDLVSKGSLEYIVKRELSKFAKSSSLPQGLQNDSFRNWLLTDDCVARFVEVLIAQGGGDPALAGRAEVELADRYERATGDSRKLATGPLNLAVSLVYGQLQATKSGREALRNALELKSAAQLHALRHPERRLFPTDSDLASLRNLSAQLLAAGRATWKMPEFVASLKLEAYDETDDKEGHQTSPSLLLEALKAGENIVLFGDGGIGKTTYLLELASMVTQEPARRTPLYIDAATWARSGLGVLDYLAASPSAQVNGVTSRMLAQFAEAGLLILMVNGWNEIPADRKAYCLETFDLLTVAAPALAVALTSRTPHDIANLRKSKRIAVRGLTWKGQTAIIKAEIGEMAAQPLLELLAKDAQLRYAARSPLILRGLVSQANSGTAASASVFDLLGAVVRALEQDVRRQFALNEAPVSGLQAHYLEELACILNDRETTAVSLEEALPAVSAAAVKLISQGYLGAVPTPRTVLEVLANFHVLHIEDEFIRFAHHRFQEYFGAIRLLRIVSSGDESTHWLREAVNRPAWDDSLGLVAGKLKSDGAHSAARARLVRTAGSVDLGYACDLAGRSALREADDSELHLRLIARVNELSTSPIEDVQDLATAFRISSHLTALSERIWTLLESDDEQTRLNTYRLSGSGISLAQLGPGAAERIRSWTSERRSELLSEISSNPDNYDFVVNLAFEEPDPGVRAAAISALLWNFPASTVGLDAWLKAPLEVQVNPGLLRYLEYSFEQGVEDETIREKLRTIASGDISDIARLQLALAFPDELGQFAVEPVLAQLKSVERRIDDETLLSIAKAHAPGRLRTLALELIAEPRGTPDWVGKLLLNEAPNVQEAAFERAWVALQGGTVRHLSSGSVGPLSSRRQTIRSIEAWLRHCTERRKQLNDAERERGREIGDLLAHAPGEDLMSSVMQLAASASYEEACELVDVLLTRISRGEGRTLDVVPWMPTTQQVSQLLAVLGDKSEQPRDNQDRLFVLLASVASYTAPVEFSPILLEAARRQLDAWTSYRAELDGWLKQSQGLPRPQNPSLGLFVSAALSRWGTDALPALQELLSHPNALDLVSAAIGRIASLPWASTATQTLGSIVTDIQVGRRRLALGRAFKQPTDSTQAVTDSAANDLARLLDDHVERELEERRKNSNWSAARFEYRTGQLIQVLANLPSPNVVAPVVRALGSGTVGMYGFLGAIRGLIRQGWILSDTSVARQLEALYQRETTSNWVDQSKRSALAELIQLMFLVEPTSLLSLPISHYLREWQRFAHISELARTLGEMKTEQAWRALLALSAETASNNAARPEELAYAIASALLPEHFSDFVHLVSEGTYFSWCRNDLTVRRIAPAVAAVVKNSPERLALLVDACRAKSPSLANSLLWEVLSKVGSDEEQVLKIGLDAIDAGGAEDGLSAQRLLESKFVQTVSLGENQYEIHPRACNSLRRELYRRANVVEGVASTAARRILASVELSRRQQGRPTDEHRHPELNDGMPWTDALSSSTQGG